MLTLKEIIAADIADVFLNPEDFGSSVNIDGVNYDGVLGPNMADASDYEAGINESRGLFLELTALDPLPVVGQQLEINGSLATVTKVDSSDSVVVIYFVRRSA